MSNICITFALVIRFKQSSKTDTNGGGCTPKVAYLSFTVQIYYFSASPPNYLC